MKDMLFCLMLCVAASALGQIRFEPGYYTDAQNVTQTGLIRNVAWRDNPEQIDFKTGENETARTIDMSQMLGFTVGDQEFRRFTVDIDTSPSDVSNLSESGAPVFEKRQVLLRLLASGNHGIRATCRVF